MLLTNEEEQAEREQLARDYLEMANAALDLANHENFPKPRCFGKSRGMFDACPATEARLS